MRDKEGRGGLKKGKNAVKERGETDLLRNQPEIYYEKWFLVIVISKKKFWKVLQE